MTGLCFRDAQPDDAAALAELGRQSFTETFGHLYHPDDLALFLEKHRPERWAGELADPRFAIRVGEAEGGLAAYAKLGPPSLPLEPRGAPIELRQFYVLRPWHGGGAAAELMAWVLAEARRRGTDSVYLSVFKDNRRARRFYDRYGFQFVKPYAFMVGSHADEDHILRLDLEPEA